MTNKVWIKMRRRIIFLSTQTYLKGDSMKKIFVILSISLSSVLAHAETLHCTLIEGVSSPQYIEKAVDTSLDSTKPETFVRYYDVAFTATGNISVSLNNLNKTLLVTIAGNRRDDNSVGASGSFSRVGLEAVNPSDPSKSLSVSCAIK